MSVTTGYSAREVAKLLGLPVSRVHSYVRAGFLKPARGPKRELAFTFQDVVVLRTASELVRSRIAPSRVKRILKKLANELPEGRTLAAMTIVAEGDRVVARAGGQRWNPENGQQLFDFDVAELAESAEPIVRRAARAARSAEVEFDADDWYELGVHLEIAAPDDARDAYRRALELAPSHAEAHINLGRLLHEQGELAAAEEQYRAALASHPESVDAAFNLGVVLEDQGRSDEAVFVYERIVKRERGCADAHFNLARLYERSGRTIASLRHLKEYKRLTVDH
ncbi:MAG TPA: tetratricopeptide repeat protein [Candidatus Polarisedimenticolaceae bacterium]|nr:tetratricopeptide repeat protein [Candidatus Polarisedimenticolaceae bacterium]